MQVYFCSKDCLTLWQILLFHTKSHEKIFCQVPHTPAKFAFCLKDTYHEYPTLDPNRHTLSACYHWAHRDPLFSPLEYSFT